MVFVESARPRFVREHPRAGLLAVGAVCLGAFMGQLDASIVTLTFPAVQREFGASLAGVEWVSLAYLLTIVGLVVATGRISDSIGRKTVYLQGFVVFTVASAACALAPGLGWLIGFRVLQAVGAAMLQANSVALVVTSVPANRMRAALGVQAGAQALGLALGPAIGGMLVDSVGWRWVYGVNVPVGIVALIAGRYLLPRTRHRAILDEFDWRGLLLLIVCTSALLLAVSSVSGLGVPAWVPAVLVVVSVLAGAGLWWWSRRAADPLIDLEMVRPKAVCLGLAGAFGAYLVLFGPLALFPQLHGASAGTGLILTALPAGFALAAVGGGRVLPDAWDGRRRERVGAVLATLALAALLCAPASGWWVFGWLGVLGLGLGVFIPSNNTGIMSAVPAGRSGTSGGLVNMARGLGTAGGVAVVTFALHLDGDSAGPISGPRAALLGLLFFAVLAAATTLTGRRAQSRTSSRREESPMITSAVEPAPVRTVRPDETAVAEVIACLRRAMRRAARAADPANTLSVAQLELLSCVSEHPGVRPGQLARLLRLAPNSVTTLVNGLQTRDMITRAPGEDRRAVTLTLTSDGEAAVEAWQATNTDILRTALDDLHPGWQHLLAAAMPALTELTRAIDTLADPVPAQCDSDTSAHSG
ncbi:MFS transporter [Nocardia macrotermitis]|uniref:Putative multidrug resistance protein MdtD n=1 Tax=Nocardia macrotermitis TaxID=2585198 RepID=A0A7K0D515_9NOCA|nr:MFS transporter [Nocardia macrotermitis]MQY20843.1 putative multidrug resistance protein MdtD [Nocardia macrotermitis]